MGSWWYPVDTPLILASSSPRRKTILELAGIPFRQVPSNVAEEDLTGEPEYVVEHWARLKASQVSSAHPSSPVLGADTMVALDSRLLGKPASPEDAESTLGLLSGRWHTVFGGVALEWTDRGISFGFSEATRVRFRDLSSDEITAYVRTGEPLDKAGSYGIQGYGSLLVDRIEGCFFNVMGLPVARFFSEFHEAVTEGKYDG
jgi:septum formation protein